MVYDNHNSAFLLWCHLESFIFTFALPRKTKWSWSMVGAALFAMQRRSMSAMPAAPASGLTKKWFLPNPLSLSFVPPT